MPTETIQPDVAAAFEELLPSDRDVAFYEEHGYWISGKILPDEVIDAAVHGAQRHWAGDRDWPLPATAGFGDWTPADGDVLRNSEYVSLQNREISDLVRYPLIGMIAARLSRSGVIRLWDDQLVSKPPTDAPKGPVVGWHSDRAYWMTCSSPDMLTAWIPLHDCPVEMGPVIYLDGSHRWPDAESVRDFKAEDLGVLRSDRSGADLEGLKRTCAIEKGQVSFHHSRLVHGSDVNRSDRPRTAIALHMQDKKNRYRTYRNEAGEIWRLPNDDLCRSDSAGLPDYTDPDVFPVLFGPGRESHR